VVGLSGVELVWWQHEIEEITLLCGTTRREPYVYGAPDSPSEPIETAVQT
jgi:hypothetical protein